MYGIAQKVLGILLLNTSYVSEKKSSDVPSASKEDISSDID